MPDIFDKFNDKPPVEQELSMEQSPENGTTEQNGENSQQATTEPPAQGNGGGAEPPQGNEEFIDIFNKRFNTQYKGDDDIKSFFELPKKVTEYEQKLKDKEALEASVEQYKRDLEESKKNSNSKLLSSPLVQKAYVADQLLAKYPDKDPHILTELAMGDTSKMSDIEVLAKERKVNYPNRKLEDIKIAILSDLGIDPTTSPEEWDSVARTRLEMRADDARANIKKLTEGIELPKAEDPTIATQRAAAKEAEIAQRSAPFKAEYSKFDKFNMGDNLDYTVPKEFQDKLPEMFDAFIKAGNEPTAESMAILNDIRDATFFSAHRKEILAAMMKEAETRAQAKLDEKLGNTQLPNTSTASDGANGVKSNLPGVEDWRRDARGDRINRLP